MISKSMVLIGGNGVVLVSDFKLPLDAYSPLAKTRSQRNLVPGGFDRQIT